MKTLVAAVVALSFVAGLAGQADAATSTKKKRLHSTHSGKQYYRAHGYRDPDDSIGGYYEHRLDAVRFGSQRWWKIYDEQRGGSRR
jgi:Ni/Co efflux regulator RcnB